jgi:nucleoside-diphosphate-sugar epimerase
MIAEDVKDFYPGKRVAVIGGAGMIGHKLVEKLLENSATVFVIDDFSRGKMIVPGAFYGLMSSESARNLPHFVFSSDMPDPHLVRGIDAARPWEYFYLLEDTDMVFNLAATVAGVLHNENHHAQMFQENASVLAGPLRASERAGVLRFLQTSSVCIYAEEYQSPCVEVYNFKGEPHPANAGYAEAKRDGERLLHWSKMPFGVIVRPSNVVGEYDYFDDLAHVIPAFIKRAAHLKDGETFGAYGNPLVKREFIYSGDVAEGMMAAMAKGENREAYNVGVSTHKYQTNTITMLTLATKCIEHVRKLQGKDPSNPHVKFDNTRGGGDSLRYSEGDKLRALGWAPDVNLDTAIHKTADYYLTKVAT